MSPLESEHDGCEQFERGDLVFARVKGHPVWQAWLVSKANSKGLKLNCFFYGMHGTGVVQKGSIYKFNQASKMIYGKQKRKGTIQAIHEPIYCKKCQSFKSAVNR